MSVVEEVYYDHEVSNFCFLLGLYENIYLEI